MASNSKIEWCDHTFNPWVGCTKVSPGCDHCYAEALMDKRMHVVQWGQGRKRTRAANWKLPLLWERGHGDFMTLHNRRQRVFCASLADVFDNDVPTDWREDLFELVRCTPHLDWLLLTKRPQNITRMVRAHGAIAGNATRYLPLNVWLGTTVEDQKRADINIPALLRTRGDLGAGVLFLSMEPLLGPVDLERPRPGPDLDQGGGRMICQPWLIQSGIDWVIVGGESGPNARPMHPAWAQSLRDQCQAAGVPFLFKQWGHQAAGRELDGLVHHAFPSPLQPATQGAPA